MLWMHLLELYTNVKASCSSVDIDFLLHAPTILVVGLYFSPTIWWYLVRIRQTYSELISLAVSCLIAGHITALGFLLIKVFDLVTIPLWFGFLITTLILLSLVWCGGQSSKNKLTYRDAVVLGLVQACALLPGISRFASTYVAARWLGFYPRRAFGYSFALQIPLLAAAFLKGLYDVYQEPVILDCFTAPVIASCVVATVLAYLLFVWVGRVIDAGKMHLFAWYVAGTALLAYAYGL